MIDLVMLNFSFAAGLAAFFNPCGFAMLPAYVSYYLGKGKRSQDHWLRSSLHGVSLGLAVSSGFFTVFGGLGLIFSLIGSAIAPYIPWVAAFIGLILIAVGVLMLVGKSFAFASLAGSMERLVDRLRLTRSTSSAKAAHQQGLLAFYLFGISYALCSVGCTLPIFMVVVTQAITKGALNGLFQFLAYAWGMSILMIGLSLAIALARDALYRYLKSLALIVQKLSALVLIGAGIYVIWYQLIYARIITF